MVYRNREEPYKVADELREWQDYFRTHQPSEWLFQEGMRVLFGKVYGEEALAAADRMGKVPENIYPIWVYPRDYAGKKWREAVKFVAAAACLVDAAIRRGET
jgi:hypothetical protein